MRVSWVNRLARRASAPGVFDPGWTLGGRRRPRRTPTADSCRDDLLDLTSPAVGWRRKQLEGINRHSERTAERPRRWPRCIATRPSLTKPPLTRNALSSTHARSIPRDERCPRAYAYTNNATIIAGFMRGAPVTIRAI